MGCVSSMQLHFMFFSVFALLFLGYSSAADEDQSLIAASGSAPSPTPRPMMKRTLVAVQGVVYCKPCKYHGVGTLLGASPLSGAVVRLQCNNSKYPISEVTSTDKNGYFLLQASKKITNYGAHKCKMYLVSAPNGSPCNKPTDLHMGLSGANLMIRNQQQQQPAAPSQAPSPSSPHALSNYTLYTVGPFAFDPTTCPPPPHAPTPAPSISPHAVPSPAPSSPHAVPSS